jgi:hypothetical protein
MFIAQAHLQGDGAPSVPDPGGKTRLTAPQTPGAWSPKSGIRYPVRSIQQGVQMSPISPPHKLHIESRAASFPRAGLQTPLERAQTTRYLDPGHAVEVIAIVASPQLHSCRPGGTQQRASGEGKQHKTQLVATKGSTLKMTL